MLLSYSIEFLFLLSQFTRALPYLLGIRGGGGERERERKRVLAFKINEIAFSF